MTFISNSPIWWSTLASFRVSSYFAVVRVIVVLYDWGLTFGQEFELIWTQRWSLMTTLYLSVRYIGIPFNLLGMSMMSSTILSTSMTDESCIVVYLVREWISVIANIMLSAIMIARLHAMYQQSRKILTILTVLCLVIQTTCIVIAVIQRKHISAEEFILSGIDMCGYFIDEDSFFLDSMTWVLGTVWEVVSMSLAVWIAVKHFRELQRPSTGWAVQVGDCFTILMETHVFYFTSFVVISCLQLSNLSPAIINLNTMGIEIYYGVLQTAEVLQMFVLGPRLILGVREYHARANSAGGGSMGSVVFLEHIHITTGDGV